MGHGPDTEQRGADATVGQAAVGLAVRAMGFIGRLKRRLFGPRLRWECVDCGTVHRSNPKRCSNCGNTILRQKRDD